MAGSQRSSTRGDWVKRIKLTDRPIPSLPPGYTFVQWSSLLSILEPGMIVLWAWNSGLDEMERIGNPIKELTSGSLLAGDWNTGEYAILKKNGK